MVNITKSEILEIERPISALAWQHLGVPIHKASEYITYLGIKIGKTHDSLYQLNYPPLIARIQTDLKKMGASAAIIGWKMSPNKNVRLLPSLISTTEATPSAETSIYNKTKFSIYYLCMARQKSMNCPP